jgi:hypothetical protein
VKSSGEGEIMPWRSPPERVFASGYMPCPDCFAFFQQDHLWRHHKDCAFCTKSDRKHNFRSLKTEAELLIPSSNEVSAGLENNIVRMMNRDENSILIRNDATITKYGENLFQKHGHMKHLHNHISSKMRELARLVMVVRNLDSSVTWLADCLHPSKFDVVVKAGRQVCGFSNDTNKYAIPSLALKLGHALKKCCAIATCASIKDCDDDKRKASDDFKYLCDKEWTTQVSSAAMSTLASAKMNKSYLLPLTEESLTVSLQRKARIVKKT